MKINQRDSFRIVLFVGLLLFVMSQQPGSPLSNLPESNTSSTATPAASTDDVNASVSLMELKSLLLENWRKITQLPQDDQNATHDKRPALSEAERLDNDTIKEIQRSLKETEKRIERIEAYLFATKLAAEAESPPVNESNKSTLP